MVSDRCQGESWEQFSPQFVCKLVKFLPVYELLWLECVQEHRVRADLFWDKRRSVGDQRRERVPVAVPPTSSDAHLVPSLARLERKISCASPARAALPACKQVPEKSLFLAAGSLWGPSQESCFRFIENCCVLAEHDMHKTNVRF